MPSQLHEFFTALIRHRPALAPELLVHGHGMKLPVWKEARLESGDLTDVVPTEYRADGVVTLTNGDNDPVLAVVVEVQLRRDAGKRWSWPAYLGTLRARLRCPVILLVICPDPATAGWCASPIPFGHPGLVLVPLVIGPDQVPVVTDTAQAGDSPELAVLSAMAHGARPDGDRVLHALRAALEVVDHEHAKLYADVVLSALPEATRRHLEALMTTRTYEYQSDFARRYYHEGEARGEARGEAKAVLAVLAARGVAVPADARERVTTCTDLDQLDIWIHRAATIDKIHDLFD